MQRLRFLGSLTRNDMGRMTYTLLAMTRSYETPNTYPCQPIEGEGVAALLIGMFTGKRKDPDGWP